MKSVARIIEKELLNGVFIRYFLKASVKNITPIRRYPIPQYV